MKVKTLLFLLACSFSFSTYASNHAKSLSYSVSNKEVFSSKIEQSSLIINLNLDSLKFTEEKFANFTYTTININGFGKSYINDEPDLPTFSKLIFVPSNVKLDLAEINYDEQILKLDDLGFLHPIKPATQSVSKSSKNQQPIPKKGELYNLNTYASKPVVELKEIGVMNNLKVYELLYQPLAYNPVQSLIKIRKAVNVSLANNSSDFNVHDWNFFSNRTLKSESAFNETYAIVAPKQYKNVLSPFVQWKQQLGYNVIEAYIGEQIASENKSDIKAYLKQLYMSPGEGFNPVKYILLVGDVDQIPTWNGVTEPHVTDLYYAEYTNDILPDAYYGRMSVSDSNELISIINKTLWVEQGAGIAKNHYTKHILVSGVDADFAPIYGNGAVNYLLNYYSNELLGINPDYYLYKSGSPITSESSSAKNDILNKFSEGAGIVYYTAHCDVAGWSEPEFSLNDIEGLSNQQKYPLMISNCCESLMFNRNSFGEEIVRVNEKGAVAYIGATNYSYWDEDYYWGVGLTSNINANPTYEQTELGAFDAWFHTHNEAQENQANTVAEIMMKGNLAVQASSSQLKDYYWEVYQIMGDPSLVPVKYEYPIIEANYEPILRTGIDILSLQTEPDAIVSLMFNDQAIGAGEADENGLCTFYFNPVKSVGEGIVELVVSKPGFSPLIDKLSVQPSEGAYVMFNSAIINDSTLGNGNKQVDYGESVLLQIEAKNYGNKKASSITCELKTESKWVINTEHLSYSFQPIDSGEVALSNEQVIINVKNNTPNNELINFKGVIIFNNSDTTAVTFNLMVNAPDINLEGFELDVTGIGNKNGIIEAEETATIDLSFINASNSQVTNTLIEFYTDDEEHISVLNQLLSDISFNANEEKILSPNIKGDSELFDGEKARFYYDIKAGAELQYSFNGYFDVILGETPTYKMSNNEVEVVSAYFYDSGGSNENYGDNENYQITFKPHYSNQGLQVNFNEFSIEQMANEGCYDILSVYDGVDENAPLIGDFCSLNYIETINSQNESGALTFSFTSDPGVNETGWKALIDSYTQYQVKVKVTDGVDFVDEANVSINHISNETEKGGMAIFNYILSEGIKTIEITKNEYITYSGEIGKIWSDTTITLLLERAPNICFAVYHKTNPVENAQVIFDNDTIYTDIEGNANFYDIETGLKEFMVSASKFVDTSGFINVGVIDACYQINLREDIGQIVDNEKYDFIEIYPNPLHENENLIISGQKYFAEIKLFNYQGRLLVTKKNQPKEFALNLSNLKAGIYILQFEIEDEYYFKKLIIE